MKMRCPSCYSEFSFEQMLSDDAARELMGILAKHPKELSLPMAAYLGLFRSKTRALAWDRALNLSKEVLGLADAQTLCLALSDTVEVMRGKQQAGDWVPLKNHNYLKRVIESKAGQVVVQAQVGAVVHSVESSSKTAQAVKRLLSGGGHA